MIVQQFLLDGPDPPEHVHEISLNCIQGLSVLAKAARKHSVLLCSMTIVFIQLFVGCPQRLMAAQGHAGKLSSCRACGAEFQEAGATFLTAAGLFVAVHS